MQVLLYFEKKLHQKSGNFDTGGSLIALFVSEISPPNFFVKERSAQKEELRILELGLLEL